jgi:hypothetical protein
MTPRLTSTFVEVVEYAHENHGDQIRKGTDIPCLGHLLR